MLNICRVLPEKILRNPAVGKLRGAVGSRLLESGLLFTQDLQQGF